MDAAQYVEETCRRGGRRGLQGVVSFITNPKVIQAFLTGSAFAILGTGSAVIGLHVSRYTPLHQLEVKWALIVLIAAFWYWADHNQDRFKSLVEDVSGEEAE